MPAARWLDISQAAARFRLKLHRQYTYIDCGGSHGALPLAAWLSALAALAFMLVNVSMLLRQNEPHIGVLLAGATAWFIGSVLFALGFALGGAARGVAALPWWSKAFALLMRVAMNAFESPLSTRPLMKPRKP